MIVESLRLQNFMTHGDTALDMPDSGIVAVTGDNGGGKSALADAVCYAAFGKTIRGVNPADGLAECRVDLSTDEVDITRKTIKRAKLTWNPHDEEPVEYETPTKAQEALEDVLGAMAVWQRTHHFASDTLGFTRETDAKRKVLLEGLLNLGHYEKAYRRCLSDLKAAKERADELGHEFALKEERLSGMEDRLSDAEDAAENSDFEAPDLDVAAVREKINDLSKKRAKIATRIREARKAASDAAAEVAVAKRAVETLSADRCPTCLQEIDDTLREEVEHEFCQRAAEAKAAADSVGALEAKVADKADVYDRKLRKLQRKVGDLTARKSAADRAARAAERARGSAERIEEQIDDLTVDIEDIMDEMDAVEARTDLLQTVASVLGTKGYRAQILAQTLKGLETATNRVLDHMTAGHIRIELRAYEQHANGKVSDSISLRVEGAGGGQYKGCSTGERRRIDIAFVVALAQLSGGDGTIWFDEVFDSLDTTGVDRLISLLDDLARDRAVVIITHSRDLAKRLPAVEHWHVSQGAIAA